MANRIGPEMVGGVAFALGCAGTLSCGAKSARRVARGRSRFEWRQDSKSQSNRRIGWLIYRTRSRNQRTRGISRGRFAARRISRTSPGCRFPACGVPHDCPGEFRPRHRRGVEAHRRASGSKCQRRSLFNHHAARGCSQRGAARHRHRAGPA